MLTKTPTLTRTSDGHWKLIQSIKDANVQLLIDFSHEKSAYYIRMYRAGTCTELLSKEQYHKGIEAAWAAEEDEGIQAFKSKFAPNDQSEVITEAYSMGKTLIKHWEAMLALGLFSPDPTLA